MANKLISTSVLFKKSVEPLHVAQVAPAPWRFLNKSIKRRLFDEPGMFNINRLTVLCINTDCQTHRCPKESCAAKFVELLFEEIRSKKERKFSNH